MTRPEVFRQAVVGLRRHPSEVTLLRRDGRYVKRSLIQARPVEPRPSIGRRILTWLFGEPRR